MSLQILPYDVPVLLGASVTPAGGEGSVQMVPLIKPSTASLTANSFDGFLEEISKKAIANGAVIIDLRKLKFIDLFAMVGLIYCCADLRQNHNCHVRLELEDEGACGFLPRIGFFRVLEKDVEVPEVFTPAYLALMDAYQGHNKGLIELTKLDSYQVLRVLAKRVIKVLRYQMGYKNHDAFDLGIMVSELCNNVLDHNQSSVDGLATMQVFNGEQGKFLQIVVADRGDGLQKTLCRNQKFKDIKTDIEAIRASTALDASEHNDVTRGNGLFHLVRLALKHNGTIHIRSGNGKLYLRGDQDSNRSFTVPYLKGAQFSLAFPAIDRQ